MYINVCAPHSFWITGSSFLPQLSVCIVCSMFQLQLSDFFETCYTLASFAIALMSPLLLSCFANSPNSLAKGPALVSQSLTRPLISSYLEGHHLELSRVSKTGLNSSSVLTILSPTWDAPDFPVAVVFTVNSGAPLFPPNSSSCQWCFPSQCLTTLTLGKTRQFTNTALTVTTVRRAASLECLQTRRTRICTLFQFKGVITFTEICGQKCPPSRRSL